MARSENKGGRKEGGVTHCRGSVQSLLSVPCCCREKGKKRKGKDKEAPSSPTDEVEEDQFEDFKDLPPVRDDSG